MAPKMPRRIRPDCRALCDHCSHMRRREGCFGSSSNRPGDLVYSFAVNREEAIHYNEYHEVYRLIARHANAIVEVRNGADRKQQTSGGQEGRMQS